MSKVDDELTRRLVRSLHHVRTDDLFDGLARRRRRRRNLQRLEAGALAATVVAATAAGFIALSKTFERDDRVGGLVVSPVPIVPKANGLLAFADGSSLFTLAPSGGSVTRLRGIPEGAWLMSWSPDGSRLAVAVFPRGDGPRELWVADADGSNATRIASADNISQPGWSPDGSLIVYAADTAEGSQIRVLNADGTDDLSVGETIGRRDYFSAAFSPDGTKILFDKGTDSGFGIFVMDVDGAHLRRLSQGSSDYDPSWSPSGEQIVFTRQEAGMESDIFVMDADGSSVRRLTDSPSGDTNLYPTFSPDGTKIAYVSGVTGGPGGLVVMDADGTSPRTVVDKDVLGIAWQPLVASMEPSASTTPGGRDIGLAFDLCDEQRLGGIDFLGDGTRGAAWIGVPTEEDATCPTHPQPGAYVIAEDHTGDGVADSWLDLPWKCYVGCAPFDATDLDGNGTDELIVASSFSIMDYYFMTLSPDDSGTLQITPILVADPGHPPAGIRSGDPLRIDAGGDAGYGSEIACEPPTLIWTWVDGPVESNKPREVHYVELELHRDGMFHVVGTNDYTLAVGEPTPLGDPTGPSCGVDWNPNG